MALKVTLSISMNHEMVEDIDDRVTELAYASRSEYVRDLVRQDLDGYEADDAVAIEVEETEASA